MTSDPGSEPRMQVARAGYLLVTGIRPARRPWQPRLHTTARVRAGTPDV